MHILNEHYHIYNRGAHKEAIFLEKSDYLRFVNLLYIANTKEPLRYNQLNLTEIYNYKRKSTFVEIIAYCIMPNHFHLLLKETSEKGIQNFIHKLCTAYSMYFNIKYDHSGTIIQGQYKYKLVDNDDYFRYLIQYIHLNPFGIEEPDLNNKAKSEYVEQAKEYSKNYEFSSYKDYLGEIRPEGAILSRPTLA